jgi:hypothetical protein
VVVARQAIQEAGKRNEPIDVCISLTYTAMVFLWRGD